MDLADCSLEGFSREELFPKSDLDQLRDLIEFWNQLDLEDDFGAADRGVITSLRMEVTDALAKSPPDIGRAASISAQACLLIQSNLNY